MLRMTQGFGKESFALADALMCKRNGKLNKGPDLKRQRFWLPRSKPAGLSGEISFGPAAMKS
ncbi:MAG: hypothetical protein C6P36_09655 [Geobacillus sp.]|nr:hypothetical protein B4168_3434 [Anoxybacillus flavithermus]OAO84571.1 hypothetical protein GT23_3422 [Parageobacillus thermoglucosidasius]REK56383.1 MAG: hypothetical protein C6P36_09655 [Geobacillus sp.]